MKQTVFLLAAILGLTLAVHGAEKPNILLILADDMGYSDIGCYGGEIQTPNLDKLAADGLRFTQFYNTARCWPSRGSILTGYYAQQIRRDSMPGVPGGNYGIRPKWAPLVPELLRAVGYRSYHSGKWHIDGRQLEGGFDRSYCLEDHSRYFAPNAHFEDDQKLPPVATNSGYYATIAIADYAIKYLKEHAEKHQDKPFFLYLCFTSPHFPLQALPEDIARYRDIYRQGWDSIREQRWKRQKDMGIVTCPLSALEPDVGPPYDFPAAIARLGPCEVNRPLPWSALSESQREFQAAKMAIHAAMVDRMDREIGRVVEQLKAMGAFENTLLLFLSDNGASAEMMIRGDGHDPSAAPGSAATFLCLGPGWSSAANTPLRRHKVWVHEGGISTPLIVHWPNGVKARGELRHNPSHIIDVVPTLLELTGARWHPDAPPAPGKSLLPLFARDNTVSHDFLWWLHENNRAIRVGDWKLVSAAKQGGDWELYNLKTDRSETRNVAAEHPDKVKELSELWQQKADEYRALALKDAPPAPKQKRNQP